MKKIVISFILTVLVITGILIGIQKTTAGIKPLADWVFTGDYEMYYVKTESNNYEKLWNGKYRYAFTGYAENGSKQEIIKVIDRKLRPNAYLAIYAEGSFGEGWGEIQEEDVPSKILTELNN